MKSTVNGQLLIRVIRDKWQKPSNETLDFIQIYDLLWREQSFSAPIEVIYKMKRGCASDSRMTATTGSDKQQLNKWFDRMSVWPKFRFI